MLLQETLLPHSSSLPEEMVAIDGVQTAAVVHLQSGVCVAERNAPESGEPSRALTVNSAALRRLIRLGSMIAGADDLEDVVATFHGQHYIACPLYGNPLEGLFLFLILKQGSSSDLLARSRARLRQVADTISRSTIKSHAAGTGLARIPMTHFPYSEASGRQRVASSC